MIRLLGGSVLQSPQSPQRAGRRVDKHTVDLQLLELDLHLVVLVHQPSVALLVCEFPQATIFHLQLFYFFGKLLVLAGKSLHF